MQRVFKQRLATFVSVRLYSRADMMETTNVERMIMFSREEIVYNPGDVNMTSDEKKRHMPGTRTISS